MRGLLVARPAPGEDLGEHDEPGTAGRGLPYECRSPLEIDLAARAGRHLDDGGDEAVHIGDREARYYAPRGPANTAFAIDPGWVRELLEGRSQGRPRNVASMLRSNLGLSLVTCASIAWLGMARESLAQAPSRVLCQKKNGALFVRVGFCAKRETAVDVANLGLVGPAGATG